MSWLLLTRGAPGSGKSTFLREQSLEPYTLSTDVFRLRLGSINWTVEGDETINHTHEARMWSELEEVLDFRLRHGHLTVVDATFQRSRDFTTPLRLAARYGRPVAVLDFTGAPLARALAWNQERPAYKRVPDTVVRDAHRRSRAHAAPDGPNGPPEVWPAEPLRAAGPMATLDRLEPPRPDLSAYEAVAHLGPPLGAPGGVDALIGARLDPRRFYIVHGPLLGGPATAEKTARWALETLIGRENVMLIRSRDEALWRASVGGSKAAAAGRRGAVFAAAQADPIAVASMLDAGADAFLYRYRGWEVLATVGGLPRRPERLATLGGALYWGGAGMTGAPEDPALADARFEAAHAGEAVLQVYARPGGAAERDEDDDEMEPPALSARASINLRAPEPPASHLRALEITEQGGALQRRIVSAPRR